MHRFKKTLTFDTIKKGKYYCVQVRHTKIIITANVTINGLTSGIVA